MLLHSRYVRLVLLCSYLARNRTYATYDASVTIATRSRRMRLVHRVQRWQPGHYDMGLGRENESQWQGRRSPSTSRRSSLLFGTPLRLLVAARLDDRSSGQSQQSISAVVPRGIPWTRSALRSWFTVTASQSISIPNIEPPVLRMAAVRLCCPRFPIEGRARRSCGLHTGRVGAE